MPAGFGDWLEAYGLATSALVALCVAIWITFWRFAKWAKPWMERYFSEQIESEQNMRKTQDSLAESYRKTSELQTQTAPLLVRMDKSVQHIEETQDDPESNISNVQTHEKLERVLRNSRLLAHSSIEHMKALIELHPECRERFSNAIELLKEIEKDG